MANSINLKVIRSMTSLPIDIISNILALLPVKDLSRFKSVNKSWYSLISSYLFSKLHFNHHNSLYHDDDERFLVFVGNNGSLYYDQVVDPSTPLNPKKINLDYLGYRFYKLIGSCNGLLLCSYFVRCYEGFNLVLVNPSTLQHKVIPKPELSESLFYGFGYDVNTNDYKVVRTVPRKSENGERIHKVAVYSLNSGTWKFIDGDCSFGVEFTKTYGVLINKHMLHWVFYGTHSRVIKSFDVCTEQWSEVPLPRDMSIDIHDDLNSCWPKPSLRCCDGHLCLLTYGLVYCVFFMEQYGVQDSWVILLLNLNSHVLTPLLHSESGDQILLWGLQNRYFWFNLTVSKESKIHNLLTFSGEPPYICIRSLVHLPPSTFQK